jgi:hypothetical protein
MGSRFGKEPILKYTISTCVSVGRPTALSKGHLALEPHHPQYFVDLQDEL